jgi:hypothetical protein
MELLLYWQRDRPQEGQRVDRGTAKTRQGLNLINLFEDCASLPEKFNHKMQ